MKKIAFLAAAGLIASSVAWAGAKDKSANTLVDLNNEGVINNATVKTKIKSKGCKLQIKAKDVTLSDGDIVICIAEADVADANTLGSLGGNGAILAGEAKSGKLKIKADLTEVPVAGNACGGLEVLQYNGNVRCYRDDATYRSNDPGAGTWRDACASMAPSIQSLAPSESTLKVNDTVPAIIGICQMFTIGDRIPGPSSALWAQQGGRVAIE